MKKKKDSDHLKAHVMCWEELLEQFLKVGFSELDIDFDMTENESRQFIIHLKPTFFKSIEEYYAKNNSCYSNETLGCIKFRRNDILIEKNHAICLSALQHIISCYLFEMTEKFEEKIRTRKAELRTKLKTVIKMANLSRAITVKISVIYYKMRKDEYFANLKFYIGKRLLRKATISSKDTLEEMVIKLKGK